MVAGPTIYGPPKWLLADLTILTEDGKEVKLHGEENERLASRLLGGQGYGTGSPYEIGKTKTVIVRPNDPNFKFAKSFTRKLLKAMKTSPEQERKALDYTIKMDENLLNLLKTAESITAQMYCAPEYKIVS